MMRRRHALALPFALAAGFGVVQPAETQDIVQNPSETLNQADSRPLHIQTPLPQAERKRTQSKVVLISWSPVSWNSGAPRALLRGPQQRAYPDPPRGSQGYLGIDVRDVSDDRLPALKLKESRGAEIIHVDHDGPAGMAGLREHDVVLQINGQIVEGREQLRRILRETPPGRTVALLLSRDGQQQTVSTQMADRATVEREAWLQGNPVSEPAPRSGIGTGNGFFGGAPIVAPASTPPITAPPDPHAHNFIGTVILGSSYTGAALEFIGPQLAQFFGSQGGNGLLVRSVDPNSPAATAGLRAGDVVVRANAVVIAGLSEWSRLVRENKGHPLSIVIVRDKQEETLVLIPDAKKRSSLDFDVRPSPEDADSLNCALLWMN